MILKNNIISLLFQSEEHPFGHTWQYWTTKWWQWFLSIPKPDNPAMDTSREKFSLSQSHPNVWFMATTIGGKIECTVRIPSGKSLLFPIINVTISNAEDPTIKTETDMISFVKTHMDDIIEKRARIDGEEILISEKFRFDSPPFRFSFPQNNVFGAHEGPTRGAADGYWIFMRPLQPGLHNISTYGSCMSGKIQIEAGIKLIVEENSS